MYVFFKEMKPLYYLTFSVQILDCNVTEFFRYILNTSIQGKSDYIITHSQNKNVSEKTTDLESYRRKFGKLLW